MDGLIGEGGHIISCDVVESVKTPVDGVRLRQVLDNLLENSIHASEEAPAQIEICCETQGPARLCSSYRHGIGFSEETIRRAMEPFFTTRETGTGLGLSIAHEIARAHNGELTLLNGPEGGDIAELLPPVQSNEEEPHYG